MEDIRLMMQQVMQEYMETVDPEVSQLLDWRRTAIYCLQQAGPMLGHALKMKNASDFEYKRAKATALVRLNESAKSNGGILPNGIKFTMSYAKDVGIYEDIGLANAANASAEAEAEAAEWRVLVEAWKKTSDALAKELSFKSDI